MRKRAAFRGTGLGSASVPVSDSYIGLNSAKVAENSPASAALRSASTGQNRPHNCFASALMRMRSPLTPREALDGLGSSRGEDYRTTQCDATHELNLPAKTNSSRQLRVLAWLAAGGSIG
jgi:hypothetical protein